MTQILLLIVWVIAVIVFLVLNFLIRKQLKGVVTLRPFARVMFYTEILVGTFLLALVLMLILSLGTTSTPGSGSFIY